eukprot:Rmarinus@m.2089
MGWFTILLLSVGYSFCLNAFRVATHDSVHIGFKPAALIGLQIALVTYTYLYDCCPPQVALLGVVVGILSFKVGIWGRTADYSNLKGKTILITGASSGIGKATALGLASDGATVIMACRDLSKAQLATEDILRHCPKAKLRIVKLDVSSLSSVREFCAGILSSGQRLYAIVNNAGIIATSYKETVDGFESTLATNHIGHVLLTWLLLPVLESHGRIVTVSSSTHFMCPGFNFDDPFFRKSGVFDPKLVYPHSKLATIYFAMELARRMRRSPRFGNISSIAVHPGIVSTSITRGLPSVIQLLLRVLNPLVLLFQRTAERGAQTCLHAVTSPSLVGRSGVYLSDCVEESIAPVAKDRDAAARVWELSVQWAAIRADELQLLP